MRKRSEPKIDLGLTSGVSRRDVLMGAAALSFTTLVASRVAQAQTAFDYFIGPNGSDSNPGTQSSPWSIHALNSKQSTYAGKRIGLLDGDYNLAGMTSNDSFRPVLNVAGGSSSSPTVVQAVNAQRANLILSRIRYGGIGQYNGSGNLQIRGLNISGGGRFGINIHGSGSPRIPGILISDCHISDIDASTTFGDVDNTDAIWLNGTNGAIVRNCLLHNVRNGRAGNHNASCVKLYATTDTVVEYCTMYSAGTGLYDKGLNPFGTQARYNYFSNCTSAFYGFDGAAGKGICRIHNNVVEHPSTSPQCGAHFMNDYGYGYIDAASFEMYNNTFIAPPSGGYGDCGVKLLTDIPRIVKWYNNILYRTGSNSAQFGDLALFTDSASLVDYNFYSPIIQFSNGTSNTLMTSLSSFSSFLKLEASSTSGDPLFAGSGTGAERYKLSSSSPCRGRGRVGGVSSGSAIDLGGWGGASRIGHLFGATTTGPVPNPPVLTEVS